MVSKAGEAETDSRAKFSFRIQKMDPLVSANHVDTGYRLEDLPRVVRVDG